MLYREFGNTGEKVSILGFGAMRLPIIGKDESKINEPEALKQIRYAIDNGVNYIDTAFPYHYGASEPFVAKVLKNGYREKVKLATKLPSWDIKKPEDMDRILNEQLQKLETDYIDFYLLHALNEKFWKNLKEHKVFDFLDRAKKDGRIKYAGFSFHDELPLFKEIVDTYSWDFCQIQYNYIDTYYQAGIEGLEYAAAKNLGIVVMEPLRGGSIVKNIPDDIQKLWNMAPVKRSAAQWALRFVWDHPAVSVVLSGMNTMGQIDENVAAAREALPKSLSDEELDIIHRVREIYKSRMAVDCTACNYCMPCPFGIDIPTCFRFLNNAAMFQDVKDPKRVYDLQVHGDRRASNCQDCGLCETKCPQHIPIREKLKEVVEIFGD
ncbi:MAG: aldo/keto reductase [Candidatus Marinimicrobia bacterium]|nr:aldo/keto reductase [Candidatus Neomarinimicrobiota bacterium]